jgi:alanine dehydrogenase
MRIGVPKEIKNNEFRIGLTPDSVRELINDGHEVFVQTQAGLGIGCKDEEYQQIGATILPDAQSVFEEGEMIVKVKEPQPEECRLLHPGQLLFTYLHLAPDLIQTDLLLESGCTAIAYETVTDNIGRLPLLAPMSEVAGRMSIQVGAVALQRPNGGRGVLLGGVPGTAPANVVIFGGGVVGTNAAKMAVGLGARVTIVDAYLPRLRQLDNIFGVTISTRFPSLHATEELLTHADLVVGAALIPGANAPKIITRSDLSRMKPGAVLVDVAIDQGGCFETSMATTHENPTYIVDGIVHYCVANMPGAVPRTSAFALNNATINYTRALANLGWKEACKKDPGLLNGLNIHAGKLYCPPVGVAQGKPSLKPQDALSA